MLDIKFIRENKDLIQAGARKKHIDFNADELIGVDDERRQLLVSVEKMRAEHNLCNDKIARATSSERTALISAVRALKVALDKEEEKLKDVMKRWQLLMLQVPNIPDISVPEGINEAENRELKRQGEPRQFNFAARDHVVLMEELGILDLKEGVVVSGFRGYFLRNEAVRLSLALWNYGLEFFERKGEFTLMLPPVKVRREMFLGTGYLPQGEDDLYKTQDGEYLSGTAEVPVMGFFSDKVFSPSELPKKVLAFSPCFRREAGSYGKDTKGIVRVHEFYKLEQVVLCEASHEQSIEFHEWINRNTEEFIESLELPYRTVVNCGGELGLGQVKKYDIELWMPSEGRYREISSASYYHDFQCRRLNIRYRDADGKLRFAHSLNATAMPSPRLLIAIIENNQEADGSVRIPKVLHSYCGFDVLSPKSAHSKK